MIAVTGHRGLVGAAMVRTGEVRVLEGDTREATAADLEGVRVLVHAAFKSVDRDGTGFAANVEGTRTLLAAAREAGVERVVMPSTVGVYGHAPHVLATEDTPLAPDTPLSRSRAECDALLLDSGLDAIVLRTRFVIGEGDAAVVPRILGAVRRSPVWLDGGRAQISLVWVEDLARLVLRAARAPLPAAPVLHVTDGAPVSFRELAEDLAAVLGGPLPRMSVPFGLVYRPVRAWERLRGIDPETRTSSMSSIRLALVGRDQTFSNARLRAWLPDFAFTPRRRALEQSAAWYRARTPSTPDPARAPR